MSLQRTFALLGLTALVCALAVAAVWQFVPLAEPQMLVFGFAPLLYVGADLLWWRWRASVVERLGASVSVEQMAAQVSLPRRAARTIFFALALLGDVQLWMAVLADVGAALLVTLNGLRLLNARLGTTKS